MATCALCKINPADWAWQPFGPSEEPRTAFCLLGSHIRGFALIKACDDCKARIQQRQGPVTFLYQARVYQLDPTASAVQARTSLNGHAQGDRFG